MYIICIYIDKEFHWYFYIVNPQKLVSIICSIFLTGPLLVSINFNIFKTSTQDNIHVHAEQAMNHAHVNKEFAYT